MTHPDPTTLTLTEANAQLEAGELRAVELTEAYLGRIAATEPCINAYTTVTAERARADASASDARRKAGQRRSALDGIPMGLKDLFDTAGIRTTAGSALWRDRVPTVDSAVAARLAAAGAVLLGKHATHEFAWGGTTNNPHFGATHNPYDLTRIPGGSSGGSAASVVARSALASIGTDTCGSVRIPSALSGCVGIKPTRGRISLAGARSLAASLDHAGPIARNVRDAALVLDVLLGNDGLAKGAASLVAAADGSAAGQRVGRLGGYFEDLLEDAVRRAMDAACARLVDQGARVTDIDIPDPGHLVDHIFTLVQAEAAPPLLADFARDPDQFGPDVAANLRRPVPSERDVENARKALAPTVQRLRAALSHCDALLSATEPGTAPPIGADACRVAGTTLHIEWFLTRLTAIFNVAALPALSVPVGVDGAGLPIGAQLIANDNHERQLITLGAAAEAVLPAPQLT